MSVVTRVKEIGTRSLISALLGTMLLGGTSVELATWSTQTNATSSTAAITLTPPDIGAGAVGMPQSTYSGASNTTVTDIACGSPCFAIDNAGNVLKQTPVQNWLNPTPSTSPTSRYGGVLAYDPSTSTSVLFGGFSGTANTALADTWSWNGTTWTQLAPATSPPARYDSALAYDPASGQMILFGGDSASNAPLADTWSWNGTTWTQLSPATSPPAEYGAMLTYDPALNSLILFGGIVHGTYVNTTWSWNGTTWTQLSPATSPPARINGGLAYDSASGQMILFGGFGNGTYYNDTWSWNGTTWTQLSPATSPPAREEFAMSYDAALSVIGLFGGKSSTGTPLGDTWSWNGTTWTQLSPATSPPARYYPMDTYDPTTGAEVLFAGYGTGGFFDDTWLYETMNSWPVVASGLNGGASGSQIACTTATCFAWFGNELFTSANSWGSPVSLPSTPNGSTNSVTCSGSDCVALTATNQFYQFNGSSWSLEPSAPFSTSNGVPAGVGCTSTTSCWAITKSSYVAQWNGTTWTAPAQVDSNDAQSISCNTSDCWVGTTNGDVFSYTVSSATWSLAFQLPASTSLSASPIDVSCSSAANSCIAIATASSATNAPIWQWVSNGFLWAELPWSLGNSLASVSCQSAIACAIGTASNGSVDNITPYGVIAIARNGQLDASGTYATSSVDMATSTSSSGPWRVTSQGATRGIADTITPAPSGTTLYYRAQASTATGWTSPTSSVATGTAQ